MTDITSQSWHLRPPICLGHNILRIIRHGYKRPPSVLAWLWGPRRSSPFSPRRQAGRSELYGTRVTAGVLTVFLKFITLF